MFDPYHKWLGILPKDQPPNHYRLLGLEIFESDLDVIEGAVDRQMSFVRQYQSGEHAQAAAKILNELANARLCLLKPATKTAYDEKLHKALVPAQTAAPLEPEFLQLPFSAEEPATHLVTEFRSPASSKSKGLPLPLLIGAGAVAVLVVIAAVFTFGDRSKPSTVGTVKPRQNSAGFDEAIPSGKESSTAATKHSLTSTQSIAANPVAWVDTKPAIEPIDDPIDLLKLVDLKRDAVAGEWQRTTSALIGPAQGKLFLPIKPPDDYQLNFSMRRLDGNEAVALGFVMAGRLGSIVLDGIASTYSGMNCDGQGVQNNCATLKCKLFSDQLLARVALTVHPGHVHVAFEGKTIVDWHGHPDRLLVDPTWLGMVNREQPCIALYSSKFVFESATLTPLKPQTDPKWPDRLERVVDVLPLIDTDRDARRDPKSGIWSLDKNVLRSPGQWGQIYIPTIVPKEYTLSTTVELPSNHQGGYALTIGLVAQGSYFQFTSDASCTGLDMIDGQRWSNNETRLSGPLLKPGMPVQIECTVTKGRIRVEGNRKPLVDWHGDIRRLSMPQDWAMADGRRLFLGAMQFLKFREVRVGPPISPAELPKHPPLSIGKPLDLMTVIEPARDSYDGTWERDGTAFRCRGDTTTNKLAIPIEVPDEYKLTMAVTRLVGGGRANECLMVGLPIGPTQAFFSIDGGASTSSGIHNENWKGTVIPADATKELVFFVQKTGLKVTRDGMTFLEWKGNPASIPPNIWYATPGRRMVIGSWNQSFRFEKLELEPLPATEVSDVAPLAADGKLLPAINVKRDARMGEWVKDEDSLICPNAKPSRLRIPVPVPSHYCFSTTVERTHGVSDLMLGLVVDGYPCSINLLPEGTTKAGIDRLDGLRFNDSWNVVSRRFQDKILPKDERVPLVCWVTPDTILVWCGDKEVIRWHGDPRRLSPLPHFLPPHYDDDDRKSLWLGAWESGFLFRDLELRPLTDTEKREITQSFSNVFPSTSQLNIPLATRPETLTGSGSSSPSSIKPPSANSTSLKKLEPAKVGEWVDLLEWTEGVDWAPRGINWNDNIDGKAKRSGIRLKNGNGMRFPLAAIIDGDYELEMEFTRYAGNSDAAIVFPVGIHNVRLLLSAGRGDYSEIAVVDQKPIEERRPGTYTNNQPHRVVIRVHNDANKAAFHIDFDETKDYFHWEGATSSLTYSDNSMWKTTMIRHAWIGSLASDIVFHKARIKMGAGTIERDVITDADREQDLKNGFVRLVGEPARASRVAHWEFAVNQIPLSAAHFTDIRWPMITRDPKPCDDFYGVHAPSRVKCPIPQRAKSFSVVGYNEGSREAKYILWIDGKEVYDSGVTGTAIIKIDIPPKSSLLELITDPAGSDYSDHTYWCYPRFHPIPADQVTDKMLDAKSIPLKFSPQSGTAQHGMTRNQLIAPAKSLPVHFRDALACDEFLLAHAPSTVTYAVADGMRRFTSIGYNPVSHHVEFEVWADAKQIYNSSMAGIVAIDVKLPPGTKTIELKIQDLGDAYGDDSMWCFPRLHRK